METKQILITGLTGQDGRILASKLLKEGHDVYGIVRKVVERNKEYDMWDPFAETHIIDGDVRNVRLACCHKYDEVYHLAAQSHVGYSFTHPEETYDINFNGTVNMLLQTFTNNPQAHFYFAGTSEMYGLPKSVIQNEYTPFDPQSPYAIAKVAAYHTALYYRKRGYFVAAGITMNHESEIRGEDFVTRKITKGIAEYIKTGKHLYLGNPNATRDWGYAPDFVDGFIKSLRTEIADTFVFGTGEMHSVMEFYKAAIDFANELPHNSKYPLTYDDVAVFNIPKNLRPLEAGGFCADYIRAKNILGWEPKTKFPYLVRLMMLYDMGSHDR